MSATSYSAGHVTVRDTADVTCPAHPGSRVRRYRSFGPLGAGVYPQCVPKNGEPAHLLSWPETPEPRLSIVGSIMSEVELIALRDAASGLTARESAVLRQAGLETVKAQRKRLLLKLDARNMSHAIRIAVHDGLIEQGARRR